MKILVFGASGSGTTTLAREFALKYDFIHLDADEYYWKKTSPPYQIKIPLQERSLSLMNHLKNSGNAVISGSLSTWGKQWLEAFDLGVFLIIPQEIRIKRLKLREIERYGAKIDWDSKTKEISDDFIEWAKQYDDPSFEGRGVTQHKRFIEDLKCPTITIYGDTSTDERIKMILKRIDQWTEPNAKTFK